MEPIRVLIADDFAPARGALRALLQTTGDFEVVAEAADGQEALLAVAEKRPDLALLDVRMPKMDGVAATRAIRAQWPATRVLLTSSIVMPSLVWQGLQAGASGFLPKGVPLELLASSLRAIHSGAVVIEEETWQKLSSSLPGRGGLVAVNFNSPR